jgi:ribosome modulation factor
MSGCPITNAVQEGVDAYCSGVARDGCPYDPGTIEHRDWLCGWDEAAEIDREEHAQQ